MLSILLLWKCIASSFRPSSHSIIIEKQPKRPILSQKTTLAVEESCRLQWTHPPCAAVTDDLRHVENRSEWDSVLTVGRMPAPDNPSTEKEASLLSALMALVWQEYWKVEKGAKSTTLTTWRDLIFQVPGSSGSSHASVSLEVCPQGQRRCVEAESAASARHYALGNLGLSGLGSFLTQEICLFASWLWVQSKSSTNPQKDKFKENPTQHVIIKQNKTKDKKEILKSKQSKKNFRLLKVRWCKRSETPSGSDVSSEFTQTWKCQAPKQGKDKTKQ